MLLAILVLGPIQAGLFAWIAPTAPIRRGVVFASVLVFPLAALALWGVRGTLPWTFELPDWIPTVLELVMAAVVIGLGRWVSSWAVMAMGVIQAGCVGVAKMMPHNVHMGAAPTIICDDLSLVMIVVVTLVACAIYLFAVGYMDRHEHHGPSTQASQGQFFFFMVGFLGAMNGLFLANDMRWLSIFWEATTICSFMLIGHDRTAESNASAFRALIINVFGGTAMMIGGVVTLAMLKTEGLNQLVAHGREALVPLALLVLAGCTKSAQMPFQSWLLGAMVAPTPVSALLHSSTMVKAGVYLIVRVAPGFVDTKLAAVVALCGAFTFVGTSALAVGQSNGKKVLAYSTIANLGLIIACAGMNSKLAFAAAIMLIVFHAIAKALLFICMGAIEQGIHSRDIEDMEGLLFKMPFTTTLAVIGMVSMLVPPFGVLIAKWMTIEAAALQPVVLLLLVLGSALTVVFWAKWIGRINTASYHPKYVPEGMPRSMSVALLILAWGTVISAIACAPTFNRIIIPMTDKIWGAMHVNEVAWKSLGDITAAVAWPLLILFALVIAGVWFTFGSADHRMVRRPFMCGENCETGNLSFQFRSIADKCETAMLRGYYVPATFGEASLTSMANPIALLLLLSLFGVLLP